MEARDGASVTIASADLAERILRPSRKIRSKTWAERQLTCGTMTGTRGNPANSSQRAARGFLAAFREAKKIFPDFFKVS
jgi:hypothetical protein